VQSRPSNGRRRLVAAIYGNAYEIVQGPGYAAILYEMIHEARVIPLDNRPQSKIKTFMGDARGPWEGSTLVETTNFDSCRKGPDVFARWWLR